MAFQFGKDLVLDDLLDNEWHGKDQRRSNRRKCLCDDFGLGVRVRK